MNWLLRLFRRPVVGPFLVEHDDNLHKITTGSTVECDPRLPSWWTPHGGGL